MAKQESLGDLAERIAQQITTEMSAPVQEAAAITEEAALLDGNKLFAKIKFSWSPEDRAILERIRIAGDAVFEQAFTDAITVMDDFYMTLRVPEQRDVGGNRVVVTGADNRPEWKRDELGHIIEDWEQLTGQDIEYTLASLERIRFVVAPEVNKLMLEAVYARHRAQDTFDDTWGSMMDGTQGDRHARSNRESRQDRYHAFFRFHVYSVAKTFLDEITNFTRLLENVRRWQVNTVNPYRGQKG